MIGMLFCFHASSFRVPPSQLQEKHAVSDQLDKHSCLACLDKPHRNRTECLS
jgi:hypothetical protein